MPENLVTIELRCGQQGVNLDEAHNDLAAAQEIVENLGADLRYEDSYQHSVWYLDTYVYVAPRKLEAMLDTLDANRLHYDNIDLPPQLHGSALHKRLLKRYRPGMGVHVNT